MTNLTNSAQYISVKRVKINKLAACKDQLSNAPIQLVPTKTSSLMHAYDLLHYDNQTMPGTMSNDPKKQWSYCYIWQQWHMATLPIFIIMVYVHQNQVLEFLHILEEIS